MTLLRDTLLYPINSTTVDTGGAVDIRALSNAQAGATDTSQSVLNSAQNTNVERTFDPANASVTTTNNAATTLFSKGWAIPTADMDPGDTRCTAIIKAGTATVRMKVAFTGTGTGNVGANDVFTPRASLWKWNTSTNTGTLIVGGSGSAQSRTAVVAYGPVEFDLSFSLSVPDVSFAANEILLLQIGGNVACGQGLLSGARTFTVAIYVDDSTTYIDFGATGGLLQRCDLAPTGAVAPSGAITKTPVKSLSSSITPTAAIIRGVSRMFAGTISPTSEVIRRPGISMTGAVTPQSELRRTPGLVLDGSIAPGPSTIVRMPTKSLSSTLIPSATLNFVLSKFFTGAITPTAVMHRTPTKYMTSTITPGPSTVVRTPIKLLESNITPSAVIRTLLTKNFRSTLTPTGAVTKALIKFFSGSVTPSGNVTKRPTKYFTGNIGPEGGGITITNIFRRIFIDD